MQRHQFIEFAIQSGALWLWDEPTRKLKSGRMSPYFFNSGGFSTGSALKALGQAYAYMLHDTDLKFDVLFGPAYKGISLAAVTATALCEYRLDVGFASSRKEAKDHGEGGDLIGADLAKQRVVIIDDVVTDGKAKRDAIAFIRAHGGTPVAIAIAFDRQERGITSDLSGAQELRRDLGLPVIAIATTSDLIRYLVARESHPKALTAIEKYQKEYGVAA